mmetsp:Transcript_172165/g.551843  ORF Transcript_172165/g.551843 Transcript_172165/m.551843 type:complete len:268 (+) Transcript_172165:490-1293(+)
MWWNLDWKSRSPHPCQRAHPTRHAWTAGDTPRWPRARGQTTRCLPWRCGCASSGGCSRPPARPPGLRLRTTPLRAPTPAARPCARVAPRWISRGFPGQTAAPWPTGHPPPPVPPLPPSSAAAPRPPSPRGRHRFRPRAEPPRRRAPLHRTGPYPSSACPPLRRRWRRHAAAPPGEGGTSASELRPLRAAICNPRSRSRCSDEPGSPLHASMQRPDQRLPPRLETAPSCKPPGGRRAPPGGNPPLPSGPPSSWRAPAPPPRLVSPPRR